MMSPITSLNVVCVKTGTKYTSEMVNRLYHMTHKYLSIPFTFHCYTDNPSDINSSVNVIPYVDHGLDGVWNKLFLFSPNFGNLTGKCLFFDLDIALMNNIDPIVNSRSFSSLCFVRSQWSNPKNEFAYDHKMAFYLDEASIRSNLIKLRNIVRINSSIIMWEANQNIHIWHHFMHDPEYFMVEYLGIDRFIVHEGFAHDTFPTDHIYSFFYGHDYLYPSNKKFRVCPEMSICLFNGPKETPLEKERFHEALKQFQSYWS